MVVTQECMYEVENMIKHLIILNVCMRLALPYENKILKAFLSILIVINGI